MQAKLAGTLKSKVKETQMNAYHLEMARKIVEKDHVEFGEDFVALTVMCYLKDNTQKFLITPAKQS